jgi:hypothetical protein
VVTAERFRGIVISCRGIRLNPRQQADPNLLTADYTEERGLRARRLAQSDRAAWRVTNRQQPARSIHDHLGADRNLRAPADLRAAV